MTITDLWSVSVWVSLPVSVWALSVRLSVRCVIPTVSSDSNWDCHCKINFHFNFESNNNFYSNFKHHKTTKKKNKIERLKRKNKKIWTLVRNECYFAKMILYSFDWCLYYYNFCQIISANEPRRKNEKSINNFLRLSTNRNTNLGPEKLNQWFSDKKLATLINSVDQGDRKYF